MSVWFCVPSKRPQVEAQACVDKWRAMGYSVAMHRDIGDELVDCEYLSYGDYKGYARTTNALIREVLKLDTACDWVVTGGDDTDPDQTKRADVIAEECGAHFNGSFGVMQPTGDRFAGGSIDRIAGSPWIGREFCQRMYGGRGPYWHEYEHMFVDEEIMQVALKLGVFWQRPDLTHFHRHFLRKTDEIDSPAVAKPVPEFLVKVNSAPHWSRYQAMYLGRKAAGFPGAMPT